MNYEKFKMVLNKVKKGETLKFGTFKCSELNTEKYIMINEYEINQYVKENKILETINENYGEIKGIIIVIGEGEIEELYFTFDVQYYDLKSTYYSLDIYNYLGDDTIEK